MQTKICLALLLFSVVVQMSHAVEAPCPVGFVKDTYGVNCVRAVCPPGFVVDLKRPSGCAQAPIDAACKLNCKPEVNAAAPEGRNCPPCSACPKSHLQVCNYYGNQCKCQDK